MALDVRIEEFSDQYAAPVEELVLGILHSEFGIEAARLNSPTYRTFPITTAEGPAGFGLRWKASG